MRVILDTNVLVSALLTPDGVSARLLDAWFDRRLNRLPVNRSSRNCDW